MVAKHPDANFVDGHVRNAYIPHSPATSQDHPATTPTVRSPFRAALVDPTARPD